MLRSFLVATLIFFNLFLIEKTSAQEAPNEFGKLSDSILSAENANYRTFDQLLHPYNQDELLLRKLIDKSEKTDNSIGVSYGYNQLGKLQSSRFKYLSALEYHRNAFEVAKENGQTELQMTSMNLMGNTSRKIDSIQNALDYHQEVLRMIREADTLTETYQREAGKAYHGLGKIYHALGQYKLAIDNYDSAIKKFQETDYAEGLGYSYNAKGESLEAMGKLEESLSAYEKSVRTNERTGSERLLILNTLGIAHALAHQNRAEEAKRLITSSVLEKKDQMDLELRTLLHLQYGWVLLNLKDQDQAQKYLTEGLKLAEQLNITNYIYDGNIWLHDSWLELGDYEKALNYYKVAQSTRSIIRNTRNLQFLNDAINEAENEKRDLQMQMLASENEIINLKLRRNRATLLIGALMVLIFALILYTAHRQYKINIEKRVMALEQSRLRSQMNPHFLFNSLNSIKHYIINNEPKNAVHYLNKFSKLIRRILESSSMKENSLKEELETLKLYMNIENIRFDEQIDFEVDIAPDINPQTVKIPSLILQPFLENALWHGLSSKEGKKKIRLEVRQNKKGYINIAIRDNGIGREASEKLREAKVLKRKSMGISITRERLANFSRIYRNSFDLFIEDLYKGDGSVAGTKVTLKIPTI
jgi:tetratricopeptide (TPR) repeat protein